MCCERTHSAKRPKLGLLRGIVQNRLLVLALFGAAMLLSIIEAWNADDCANYRALISIAPLPSQIS